MTITSRFSRLKAGLAAAALLAAGATAVAQAAEPESGTVSPANPKVTWGGTLTSSGIYYNAWDQDESLDCAAPLCDPFALTVEGGGVDLTIGLNIQGTAVQGNEGGGGLRITLPDGSIQWVKGTSGPETTLKTKIKAAAPGEYEITTVASYVCCSSTDYLAFAELPVAAPEPPSGGGNEPGAAPQLTITAPKNASARKIKKSRRLKVAVESTGAVSNVKALLAKGRTRIATGALASLDGEASLTLKASKKAARRLKRGTYTLTVSGTDGEGRTVGSAVKIRLGK